ncbi:hypothetical protein ACIBI7_50385 [Nonomuraea fuscirosea]|uniref:hypothetical protein n=1 Tax=Nonomuraea fuscirosea TaxID=1291556 RepID=UPI0037B4CC9C
MTLSEIIAAASQRPQARQKPYAIDPWECGCTECIIGEYKPLRYATVEEIAKMLTGAIGNHTSITFSVTIAIAADIHPDETLNTAHASCEVIVSCDRKSWTVPPHLLGFTLQ